MLSYSKELWMFTACMAMVLLPSCAVSPMYDFLHVTFCFIHHTCFLFPSSFVFSPFTTFHFKVWVKNQSDWQWFQDLLIFSLKPPTYGKPTDTFGFSFSVMFLAAKLSFLSSNSFIFLILNFFCRSVHLCSVHGNLFSGVKVISFFLHAHDTCAPLCT